MNTFFIIASVIGLISISLIVKFFLISKAPKSENTTNVGEEFVVPKIENPQDINSNYYKVKWGGIDEVRTKIPNDYNEKQNLTDYNKGTYRDKSGRYKRIKEQA